MDYILEENEKGKQVPKKVGMAPIMRDGVEYEFTTVFDLDMNHQAMASKDRTQMFVDKIFPISEETGEQIALWLNQGVNENDHTGIHNETPNAHSTNRATDLTPQQSV